MTMRRIDEKRYAYNDGISITFVPRVKPSVCVCVLFGSYVCFDRNIARNVQIHTIQGTRNDTATAPLRNHNILRKIQSP